ncbi:MAG: DUF3857 domain-containing protein, partial [Bacteroidota bacterium]
MRNIIRILLFLFLMPALTYGQSKEALEYYERVIGSKDADFEILEAPEAWKDESAVILCQKTFISLIGEKRRKTNSTRGVIRKRILIQDQAALSEFSEYFFQTSDAVGIEVIKPNGTKEAINIADAVKVETDVPKSYSSRYQSSEYYKIAIPNLEIGDILDYFKVFTEEYPSDVEIITPISDTYPIKYQEIVFDVERRWKFRYGTFNGAPKFVRDEKGGLDSKGKRSKDVVRLILKDEMRSTYKDEMWSYENATEPILKIMASPLAKGKKDRDKTEKITQSIEKEDLFKKITSLENMPPIYQQGLNYGSYALGYYIGKINFYKKSDQERADAIYDALRLGFLKQVVTNIYNV